ncbi:putative phloem protein [Helianthus annuus]|nr:putative phloem protein [Helianthus annuus]
MLSTPPFGLKSVDQGQKGVPLCSFGSKFGQSYGALKVNIFRSVAYLQQIWWFEVDGEVEFPFPCGTYTLYFRLQLGRSGRWFGRRVCNSDHVHGWDIKPVKFQLSTSDGYGSKHFLCNGRDWKPGITWTLLLDNGADVSSEAEKQRVIMCVKATVERRAPEGVRLELFKPDKPRLLAQVTRTFRENAMNVAQAEISTTMGNHSSVSKSTWTSNISSEDMLTEVLSYFTQPSIPEKTERIWNFISGI